MINDGDPQRLMRFVLAMRQAGVTDPRALSALERTSRTHFAPPQFDALAMEDEELPLPHGQAMTRPSQIGRMISALDVSPDHNVLEIGTGSGYQAAAISILARRVVTLERWPLLATDARERIGRARLMSVYVHSEDGAAGWKLMAPYDRIVLNAAVEDIPAALIEQLAPGGAILAPIMADGAQRLVRVRGDARDDLGPATFKPLETGLGVEP